MPRSEMAEKTSCEKTMTSARVRSILRTPCLAQGVGSVVFMAEELREGKLKEDRQDVEVG